MDSDNNTLTISESESTTPANQNVHRDASTSTTIESHKTPTTARSREFWFRDGSVVIQAENTLFCVHEGLLSLKSAVFKNILAIPDSAGDHIDGKPLICVSDKAVEMKYLLDALYGKMARGVSRNLGKVVKLSDENVPRLCAILSLSTKYEIPQLREAVSDVFNRFYFCASPKWNLSALKIYDSSYHVNSCDFWEADIANTLYETRLLTSLPFILYRQSVVIDLDQARTDKGLSNPVSKLVHTYRSTFNEAFRKSLIETFHSKSLLSNGRLISSHPRCAQEIIQTLTELGTETEARYVVDNLHPLRPLELDDIFTGTLCDECRKKIKIRRCTEGAKLWNDLLRLFGYEGWDALPKADAAYLANMSPQADGGVNSMK